MAVRLRESAVTILHAGDRSHPHKPHNVLQTNDYWLMKTFCVDGVGIALMPNFFAKPEVLNGFLVPLLPDWAPDSRRVFCAYQRQRYMGKKLRSFIDLVSKSVEDIDSFNTWVVAPYPEHL